MASISLIWRDSLRPRSQERTIPLPQPRSIRRRNTFSLLDPSRKPLSVGARTNPADEASEIVALYLPCKPLGARLITSGNRHGAISVSPRPSRLAASAKVRVAGVPAPRWPANVALPQAMSQIKKSRDSARVRKCPFIQRTTTNCKLKYSSIGSCMSASVLKF